MRKSKEEVTDFQAELMRENLQKYLSLPDKARQKTTIEERAGLLEASLYTFTDLNLQAREKMLGILQAFVMDTIAPNSKHPYHAINDAVLRQLADPEESSRLVKLADQLPNVRFVTAEADTIQLFEGTYTFTQLREDGSVKAYATNTKDGGVAYTANGNDLANYATMKAILGHHLILTKKDVPNWPSGTNIFDNITYFERHLSMGSSYIGNDGRLGGSGVEMTDLQRNNQAGNLLDPNHEFMQYFLAGEVDRLACETAHTLEEKMSQGRTPDSFYLPLPEKLDLARAH